MLAQLIFYLIREVFIVRCFCPLHCLVASKSGVLARVLVYKIVLRQPCPSNLLTTTTFSSRQLPRHTSALCLNYVGQQHLCFFYTLHFTFSSRSQPPHPFVNMGQPYWTREEEDYFRTVIIPLSDHCTGSHVANSGQKFGELAFQMQTQMRSMGINKRTYTEQNLFQHWYQRYSARARDRRQQASEQVHTSFSLNLSLST